MSAKYEYQIDCFSSAMRKWLTPFRGRTLEYCRGYIDRARNESPRSSMRIVRSDGKVMEDLEGRDDVNIGQIAGFPTADQYERAGNEALAKAAKIREREAKDAERRKP